MQMLELPDMKLWRSPVTVQDKTAAGQDSRINSTGQMTQLAADRNAPRAGSYLDKKAHTRAA